MGVRQRGVVVQVGLPVLQRARAGTGAALIGGGNDALCTMLNLITARGSHKRAAVVLARGCLPAHPCFPRPTLLRTNLAARGPRSLENSQWKMMAVDWRRGRRRQSMEQVDRGGCAAQWPEVIA